MNTICKAISTGGSFTFCWKTGVVSDIELDYRFGVVPIKVNVAEWRSAYPDCLDSELPATIDVLDLGYVTQYGIYTHPCYSWRAERNKMREEEEENTKEYTIVFRYPDYISDGYGEYRVDSSKGETACNAINTAKKLVTEALPFITDPDDLQVIATFKGGHEDITPWEDL